MPSLIDENEENDENKKSNSNESPNVNMNYSNIETDNQGIFLDDCKKGNLIAQGNFGDIVEAYHKNSNLICAAKIFYVRYNDYSRKKQINIIKQLNIMKQLNFPSILKYYDYNINGFDKDCRLALLSEYCQYGSLQKVLDSNPIGFDNTAKLIIIYGMAAGLNYLHKHDIYHCDLKPGTIMLGENFYPRINDIGISKYFHSLKSMSQIKEISPYISPEVLIDNDFSKKSEVYSFALIIYEILTNKKPFGNISQFNLIEKIAQNSRPYLDDSIPEAFRDLISICWSQNPEERLTFEEICKELKNNDAFLKNVERKEDFEKYVNHIDTFIEINRPFDVEIKLDDVTINGNANNSDKPKRLKKKKKGRKGKERSSEEI